LLLAVYVTRPSGVKQSTSQTATNINLPD